ncbi:hypothetical protein HanPI659440_Chr02g0085541 [Helianthus annuus]|nr:hypothetical protein HanIR_Chr02g0089221 [Helianthus annuus]KAJ0777964.1 hypothetical protein HanLR1_Chr02g0066501 [Helianthus annuus]KAJ0806077.1 hypothetical protein HanPI659440_Chr02g0085541 [Helianthus annuus]
MSNSIAVLLDPLRAHTSSAEPHSSVTHHHAQHFLTFLPILSPQHDSPQRNFIPYASSLCMLSLMPVFVFGSFTEDETKSLQSSPN